MPPPPSTGKDRRSQLVGAVEAGNISAINDRLADEVVFHPPVALVQFEGRRVVIAVIEIVLGALQEFCVTEELVGENTRALVFRARVGRQRAQGVILARLDATGRVSELTVMGRPPAALEEVLQAVAPQLAERGVQPRPER